MALVSINKAAKLVKKSRTTLYRMLNNGELSKTIDEQGNQKIDTAELLRVFGSLSTVQHEQLSCTTAEQQWTPKKTTENNELNTEIQVLRKENEMLKKILNEKEQRNQDLKQALLMLENKAPEPPKKRKKFLGIF